MNRCQCLNHDGSKCKRFASEEPDSDSRYCWQHQQCQSPLIEPEEAMDVDVFDPYKLSPQVKKVEQPKQKLELKKVEQPKPKLVPEIKKVEQPKPKLELKKVEQPKPKLVPKIEKVEQPKPKLAPQVKKVEQPKPKLAPQVKKVEQPKPKLVLQVKKVEKPEPKLPIDPYGALPTPPKFKFGADWDKPMPVQIVRKPIFRPAIKSKVEKPEPKLPVDPYGALPTPPKFKFGADRDQPMPVEIVRKPIFRPAIKSRVEKQKPMVSPNLPIYAQEPIKVKPEEKVKAVVAKTILAPMVSPNLPIYAQEPIKVPPEEKVKAVVAKTILAPIKKPIPVKVLKMDLYLSPTTQLSGGSPESIIKSTNNTINKYLVTQNYSSVYEFDPNFNTKQLNGSTYLGKGGLTAVFEVKKIKSPYPWIPDRKLIVRMVDASTNLDDYINKWHQDRQILPNNVPEIYHYGGIFKGNVMIAVYSMVKKYGDESEIRKLDFNNKKKLLQKLLQCLKTLQSKDYTYRDLKFANIGYEPDHQGNVDQFIVLDHDEVTILNINGPFFDQLIGQGCDWYCAGTFPPYYVIRDFQTNNLNWRSRLDKLSVLGLAEIIINLFYGNSGLTIVNKYIYTAYSLGDPYILLAKLFESPNQYGNLINDIVKMTPINGYTGDNNDQLIKKLIVSLLHQRYDQIPTFDMLLDAVS